MLGSELTALPALWVPMVALAHIFSGIWLLRTWLLSKGGPQPAGDKAGDSSGSAAGHMPAAAPDSKDAAQCGILMLTDTHCDSTTVSAAANGTRPGAACATDVEAALDAQQLASHSNSGSSSGNDSKNAPLRSRVLPQWHNRADWTASVRGVDSATCTECIAKHTVHVGKVEWQGVGCRYKLRGASKVVLQDIWGVAMSGEVQALMGPSGAGKSTLMDILAMRKSTGQLTGAVLLDGQPATQAFIRQTSYIPQEDNFIPAMTARETLRFYADITLPEKVKAARRRRVDEVLAAVGLTASANTLVGGYLPGGLMLRGLSGGERRRLSIAAGILAAPAVLFVDEPTSGLDSFAALSIMAQLHRIACDAGAVVICTIHQPRSAIWEMLDRVSLLACGRLMYHGVRDDIGPWFASLGYERLHGDESDWLLDLVATGFDKPQQLYGNKLMQEEDISPAAEAFKASRVQRNSGCTASTHTQQPTGAGNAAREVLQTASSSASASAFGSLARLGGSLQDMRLAGWQYPTSAGRQFGCLLRRHLLGSTRNPFDVAGRILSCTYLGLVFGLVLYNTPADTLSGLRTRANVCFVVVFLVALVPYMTISIYPIDRKIYLADASAKLYRPSAYYVSKVLASFPFSILGSLCTVWTLYGMAGLRPGWQPVLKAGTLSSLLYLIALQVLHLCSVIAPNQDLTFCLSIIWAVMNFALSSFFVNFNEVTTNAWFTQLRYISAIYFTVEGLMVNEFKGSTIDCSAGLETALASLAESALVGALSLQQAVLQQLTTPQEGCLVNNDALLEYMQYSRPFGTSVAILVGYLGVVHVLTFVGMLLLASKEVR